MAYSKYKYMESQEFAQKGHEKFNFRDLVTERKLDRALRDTDVKIVEEYLNTGKRSEFFTLHHEIICEYLETKDDVLYDNTIYARILKRVLETPTEDHSLTQIPNQALNAVKFVTMAQVVYLQQNNWTGNRGFSIIKAKELFSKICFDSDIINTLRFGQMFSDLVVKMAGVEDVRETNIPETKQKINKINKHAIPELHLEFLWSKKLMVITDTEENEHHVCPKDMNLLITNKLFDLSSVLLMTTFGRGVLYPENGLELLKNLIREFIQLNLTYKNNFYTIMKSWEGLVTAEILLKVESWKNEEFLLSVTHDLITDVKFKYMKSKLRKILLKASPNFMYELGCLSKILGHPYVNMKEGSKSLFEKVQKHYRIDMEMVQLATCYVKQNFIQNYYSRHKKWPLVKLNYGVCKRLEYAVLHNLDPRSHILNQKFREPFDVKSYSFVELEPVLEFKELEQVIPHLKDRTISLLRQKVEQKYGLSEDNDIDDYTDWRKTRLLLAYLISPESFYNHKKYLKDFDKSKDLENLLDYLIIRVVPKEKELKINFRGFGCKSFEDRMRCLAQEKTSKYFLEKYSEDQAMVVSEISLSKRLRNFRAMATLLPQHTVLYVNLDASSWCTHQRGEAVDVILSETMDKLHNTNIHGKTQLAYKKTFVYVPDGEGGYSWTGQEGGIEGLNQDSWVIVYLGEIKAALQNIKYKYYIIIRGDDVKIVFIIPLSELDVESLLEIKVRLIKILSDGLSKFGHKIKVTDCYGSSVFFSFCKQASVKDLELSQTFRKCQKVYGANNAFLETLDEYAASAFSNAHSASKSSSSVIPSYLLALFWFCFDLLNSETYSQLNAHELEALCLTPSLLGGFPIIYLHNFYVRAESDLLPAFLDILSFMKDYDHTVYIVMKRFLQTTKNLPKTYEALYNDPYSIPITRPTLPTGFLRSMMPAALKRITKNESILQLLNEVESKRMDSAIKALDSCSELHAKPLSVMYQALPKAQLTSILKMFESSRSVLQLTCHTNKTKMIAVIKKAYIIEQKLQKWRLDVIKGVKFGRPLDHLLIHDCPSQVADLIREYSWGKPVIGVTMPPMSHMMSYYYAETAPINKHIENNHFMYHIKPIVYKIPGETSEHFASGGAVPFIGFKTRPGTSIPTIQFVEKDQYLDKIKNMLELNSWYRSEITDEGHVIRSNLTEFLNKIVKIYTNLNIDDFFPFIGYRRSGVVEHHLTCQGFQSAIVPNLTTNRYTQVSGTTNTHLTLVHKAEKYKFNILHMFCHSVSILTSELDFSDKINERDCQIYGVTTPCVYCTKPIVERPLVFNDSLVNQVHFKSLSALKVSSQSIKILTESLDVYAEVQFHNLVDASQLTVENAAMGILLEDFNTYNDRLINTANQLNGHVPGPQGIEIIRSMTLGAVAKNTSITEMKAIPVPVFTSAISGLITDYILKKFKHVFTRDTAPLATQQSAHLYPWFGIFSSLHHTSMIRDMFAYLAEVTKIKLIYMSTDIADQTVKIIPLALEYTFKYDKSPPSYLHVHDLLTEVHRKSAHYSVMRAVLYTLQREVHIHLDPHKPTYRSVARDIHECINISSMLDLKNNNVTRILYLLKGYRMLTYGFLQRNCEVDLSTKSGQQNITLEEIMVHNLIKYERESEEDVSFNEEGFNFETYGFIPYKYVEIKLGKVNEMDEQTELSAEDEYNVYALSEDMGIELISYEDYETEVEHFKEESDFYSGGYIHNFMSQYLVSFAELYFIISRFRLLCDLDRAYRNTDNDIIKEITRISDDLLIRSEISIVNVPIVACGQRLRSILRSSARHHIDLDSSFITYNKLFENPPRSLGNLRKFVNLREGNQAYTNIDLPRRALRTPYSIPKFIMIKRPFGIVTCTYTSLMEIFEVFKVRANNVTIAAFGTGLGSDIVFFNHFFPTSSIVVTTLKSGNYDRTVWKMYENKTHNTQVFDAHLDEGYEDATNPRTYEKLYNDYHKHYDIQWCDIDIKGTDSPHYVKTLYELQLQFYLQTRRLSSVLIIKINTWFTQLTLGLITLCTQHAENVYTYRPESMLNCSHLYLIVWSNTRMTSNNGLSAITNDMFIPNQYYRILKGHLTHIHNALDSVELDFTKGITTYDKNPVKPSIYLRYDLAPPLWVTLLNVHLDIVIDDQGLAKITRHINSNLEGYRMTKSPLSFIYSNFVFKYDLLKTVALENLNQQRTSDFNPDNHSLRINSIKRLLFIQGFNDLFSVMCQVNQSFTFTTVDAHRKYMEFIDQFEVRDLGHEAKHDLKLTVERNHTVGQVKTGFADHYMRGINTCLSFIGWVNYLRTEDYKN